GGGGLDLLEERSDVPLVVVTLVNLDDPGVEPFSRHRNRRLLSAFLGELHVHGASDRGAGWHLVNLVLRLNEGSVGGGNGVDGHIVAVLIHRPAVTVSQRQGDVVHQVATAICVHGDGGGDRAAV